MHVHVVAVFLNCVMLLFNSQTVSRTLTSLTTIFDLTSV